MKQFQISFNSPEDSIKSLCELKKLVSSEDEKKMLLQVFSASMDRTSVQAVIDNIKMEFPVAAYVGCSTCGNIFRGDLSPDDYVVTCTVLEADSARVAAKQFRLDKDNVDIVIPEVVKFANDNEWVKMIMLYTTVWKSSMTSLCSELDNLRPDIKILGGGAFNSALDIDSSFVFSKDGEVAGHSIVFAFLGGDGLVINTRYISGWKPLGREMSITKAEGNVLQEIDGVKAFETYRKYLQIENDDNFMFNTIEFPYMIRSNGIEILRHPQACLKDGSLVMASDVESAGKIRLAYGDPETIMESVFHNLCEIRDEDPDAIMIFSCAGRKAFWGNLRIGDETKEFECIAPSAGFYTLSEFLRTGEHMNQHNLTLVVASVKEIIPGRERKKKDVQFSFVQDGRKLSTIERLANFIDKATRQLEKANLQLSDMNQRLQDMAITDGLTMLYNRSEIQGRITARTKLNSEDVLSLIMLDIDDFKKVNDTYGHAEGDLVIKGISEVIRTKTASVPYASAGRWGGEEFMVMLPHKSEDEAFIIAESIREAFEEKEFELSGHHTVSVGVTERKGDEDGDTLVSRVDKALYDAKKKGKNRTVRL